MIRSFLAFELPNDIKETVARVSEDIRKSALDIRLVKVDNIHLTVVFIGNALAEDLPAIQDAIGNALSDFRPFQISVKGAGVFPNARRPRVLWLGLDGDIERLSLLRDGLQKQLGFFGVREEKRSFQPHLTLGRFRGKKRPDSRLEGILSRYKDLGSPFFPLEELILFRSELKPGGAEYTRMKSWRFN